ncbi:MAG: LD-carboxypeptidase [Microthrixaceae bacterium]
MQHEPIQPKPLGPGSHIRVVAPSRSLAVISTEARSIADRRFAEMGLTLSFGEHVEASDQFDSTTIENRVDDLHAAFADSTVDGILTVIGGHNSNQMLPYLDWELIGSNPKAFCGYSDITALSCAIHAHTGLVTYSGPDYSTFGVQRHFERTRRWFVDALFHPARREVEHSDTWSDDPWFLDQDDRTVRSTDGPWVLSPGNASGRLIGGNLCTLSLLQGTEHMPGLDSSVLFLEDDHLSFPANFDRQLTSLSQQPGFAGVRAVLIGRFQVEAGMTRAMLQQIVGSNRALADVPVVANLDFGHTDPLLTIPVGGQARVVATADGCTLDIE